MVIKRIWVKYERKTNWRNVWKFEGLSMEIGKNVEKDGKTEKKSHRCQTRGALATHATQG